MIYTIGHRKSYLQSFRDYGEVTKIGRKADLHGEPYIGGYAFKTLDDANKRIREAYPDRDFIAFGLEAKWDEDTTPSKDGWWHHLLVDSYVTLLEG